MHREKDDLGFRVRGVRRDYYAEPVEDALILWLETLESAARLEGPGRL